MEKPPSKGGYFSKLDYSLGGSNLTGLLTLNSIPSNSTDIEKVVPSFEANSNTNNDLSEFDLSIVLEIE